MLYRYRIAYISVDSVNDTVRPEKDMKRRSYIYSILICIGILLANASFCLTQTFDSIPTGTPPSPATDPMHSSATPVGGTGATPVGEPPVVTGVDQPYPTEAIPSATPVGSPFSAAGTTNVMPPPGSANGTPSPGTANGDPSSGLGGNQSPNFGQGSNVPSATPVTTVGSQSSFGQISQSPWFALVSGVASIIGLMVTLYGTQIRTIPFSLYRSYAWTRVLLLSFGIGILVSTGIMFYTQTQAPSFICLSYIFRFLHGYTYYYNITEGPNMWAIIFLVGGGITIYGIRYDPVKLSKSIVFREHEALLLYRKAQLSSVLGENCYEELKNHEKLLYDDLNVFHVELQSRLIDTIYGQAPLPMYSRRMNQHMERTD
jgi:hypothetical protein